MIYKKHTKKRGRLIVFRFFKSGVNLTDRDMRGNEINMKKFIKIYRGRLRQGR